MQVKQCRCGGAMVEVPGYYNGPVHCGEAGCGEDSRITFMRGLKTIASKMTLHDGLIMTRRTCSRLPNPHPAYACSNPIDCPNPDNVRVRKGIPNTLPMEVITRETQPTFPVADLVLLYAPPREPDELRAHVLKNRTKK